MSFEADLRAHLGGDSAVTALAGERIHPLKRPQGESKPAITYQRISGVPQQSLDGFTSGLTAIRVQVDCWGATHDDVSRLAAAVQARMLTAAATFRAVMALDQDFYEDDTRTFRRSMDFNCWFREA